MAEALMAESGVRRSCETDDNKADLSWSLASKQTRALGLSRQPGPLDEQAQLGRERRQQAQGRRLDFLAWFRVVKRSSPTFD